MEDFVKHFVRDPQGVWFCVEPATIDLPSGRIQVNPGTRFARGTKFMNVDIAEVLDQQYEDDRARGR